MASILEQDYGSESEEGDFNPEIGHGSEDDASVDGDSKAENRQNGAAGDLKQNSKSGSSNHRRSGSPESQDEQGDGKTRSDSAQRSRSGDEQGENEHDDDNDDDNDDDDDDDEDQDAVAQRPRKRARRDPRNQFLDVEAEVDEEDEGEEEDEEVEKDGFIADTHPDDLANLREGATKDDRRHRELDMARERQQHIDAEEEVQRLREKYGRRTGPATDVAIVPRRLLLPSVDDPSIWGVKCKPGKEREIVFSIVKRMEERAGSKDPVPIISAFERGGSMAGYLYVEARRQADVVAALNGIMNVYPRTNMVLVPIREMPDLLRVIKTEQLQPGGYVRIKRGKYAGDLAQIDEIETNGLEASLRIVPRLDYGQNEDDNAPMVDGSIRGELQKRKRAAAGSGSTLAVRPPPRLFSEQEAKKKHSRYLMSNSRLAHKEYVYFGDTYVDGYLIKDFKLQHLITQNVAPTLEEVTRFTSGAEDGSENLDLSALAQTLKNTNATDNYLPGDIVEVYDGEQSGIVGRAIAVRGDIVSISVTEGDLRSQVIEVPQKGLRKRFKVGDHVKVIGGSKYRDEVGMVVSIQKDTVTLVGDLSLQEITVFNKDLREASDSGVAGGLGRYDIHDLVQLDPITVGCITKVDRESLRVLDQNGSVRSFMPSQISNKLDRRRFAVATDRNGSEIRLDDTVREVGGDRQTGVILHIYRSYLFLHNREQSENSGISVVRASNVATVAAKGGRIAQGANASGPDLSKMNPAAMQNGGTNGMPPPPRSMGRDRAIGQTVTIRRGPHKSLLGIVKDTTDTEARVELHTKSRTVSVPKDALGFKDPMTGQTIDYARFCISRGANRGPGAPPSTFSGGREAGREPSSLGSRTPSYNSSAEYSGSRTPTAYASSRTPAWSSNTGNLSTGNRTPAWAGASSSSNTGARTPAWQQSGTGSRTPAYSSSASSSGYRGGEGQRTGYVPPDGSRTVNPYAEDGSRTVNPYTATRPTPAWNPTATASSYSHLSDIGGRAYDAPTPGRDFSAPTPGASSSSVYQHSAAPTPGSGYAVDAPTPYTGAGSNSGLGTVDTPGWTGDEVGYTPRGVATPGPSTGPRYDDGTPSP